IDTTLQSSHLLVDALVGTGLNRVLQGRYREFIEVMNRSGVPIISLDLPSGLDATSGGVYGCIVRATHTITFGHLKRGLLTTYGHEYGGNLTVSHLGVPSTPLAGLQCDAHLLELHDVIDALPSRSPTIHKAQAGRVGIIGGSSGTVGAARLAAHGALRAGAGLVTIASHPQTVEELELSVREVMTKSLNGDEGDSEFLNKLDTLVIGPGLGRSEQSRNFLEQSLKTAIPLVIDADALHLLTEVWRPSFVKKDQDHSLRVLTPHAGEAAALLGTNSEAIEADRFDAAKEIARRFQSFVVLKGSRPILVGPEGPWYISAFGSPALATGGSGDIFSGLLGGMMVGAGTPAEIVRRVQLSLVLQGRAAEEWTKQHGLEGLIASEIADLIPQVITSLRQQA
ncbi:MAG: NAD(P)H-hydrate dehydratase, partial [Polyangiaceae bacterium]|nr:NAD(P)H-hydrate dehydratase [Polyangiaceae bacterium]